MYTIILNTPSYRIKRNLLFVAVFLFFTTLTWGVTPIDIPGTGRKVDANNLDSYWRAAGFWELDESSIFSGLPERIGNTTPCLGNGDHEVEFFSARPPEIHGKGDVYFYYEFQIVEQGDYSISCKVSKGLLADFARYMGLEYPGTIDGFLGIQGQTLTEGDCESVNMTMSNLTPGRYAFRVKRTMTVDPVSVVVSSASTGDFGKCVPVVKMNSDDTRTIESGATASITLSSTVSSNYVWSTAGNPNTNITAGTHTGSPLSQTITNNTGQTQAVVYTVTPTSVTGGCEGFSQTVTIYVKGVCVNGCDPVACTDCIGSFAPDAGATYVISAWVQEANSATEMTYTGPRLGIRYTGSSEVKTFSPGGPIIDGWQRIDTTFTVPQGATEVFIKLINTGSNEVYFDDLRIHPNRSSMKSFVYDPVSLRLMAELDENNYATFYEYDEEGALIRVKKETERGVKTIKETGNHIRK